MIILFLFGLYLIYTSLKLKPYTDEKKYTEEYFKLKDGDNENFLKLKDKYKSNHYQTFDLGIAMITFSILFTLSIIFKENLFRFISKLHPLMVGSISVFSTITSEIYYLFRDANRGEFPHWADSLGIPIFQSMILGLILLIWLFLNYFLSKMDRYTFVPLDSKFKYLKLDFWFYFLCLITIVLSIYFIFEGDYLQICSLFFWILYYLSLISQFNKTRRTKVIKN
ncbi:hypothetical protein AB3N60_01850 [Leptospira sp. WS39.C2]